MLYIYITNAIYLIVFILFVLFLAANYKQAVPPAIRHYKNRREFLPLEAKWKSVVAAKRYGFGGPSRRLALTAELYNALLGHVLSDSREKPSL